MRSIPFLAVTVLAASVAAWPCARAFAAPPIDAIYVCTDADGHRSYQNSNEGPQCRRVDGLVSSIPGAESSRARPGRSVVPQLASVTSASFPRIDARTQRSREADRRSILEEELRSEQGHLAQLRGQPLAGDAGRRVAEDIERSEGNIAALQRELAPQRF
jgi:hypothetical protein